MRDRYKGRTDYHADRADSAATGYNVNTNFMFHQFQRLYDLLLAYELAHSNAVDNMIQILVKMVVKSASDTQPPPKHLPSIHNQR